MNFQDITPSASPEVPMNENFETIEFASVYGRRQPTSSGLTWGYYGGRWGGFAITAGTLTLTDNDDNYVVVEKATGDISIDIATTDWLDTTNFARVYLITTGSGLVVSWEDHRAGPNGVATAATTGAIGDVAGPASAVANQLASFNGTTGKIIKDSGMAIDTDGTLSANSDTRFATQKAVKTYADQLIAAADAMVFKGSTDCSANPNYPAADRGHTYRVSVAGKIGGASGVVVEAGDLYMCLTDSTASGTQAAVGANWVVSQTNLDGAVIGPASVTSGNLCVFSGTSGKLIAEITMTAEMDAALGSTQGNILYRNGTVWTVLAPGTAGQQLKSGGAAANPSWVTEPYDVGGGCAGVPSASLVIVRYPMPRAVVFVASLTGSQGVLGTAATAQTDFDILKNGVSFGTMRFAAAGTVASFISASGATFAAGDILTVVAPASPDATAANLGFALAGTR